VLHLDSKIILAEVQGKYILQDGVPQGVRAQ
jgi:hypothetical protein